jgi:hypothetical protein
MWRLNGTRNIQEGSVTGGKSPDNNETHHKDARPVPPLVTAWESCVLIS